ncbi:MAG: NADH-quinone oxidoreductase subunit H [Cyanobacteria bacterium HKST-UBA02]|nr:NADH-quinone oxidoreductase subunit H [Cyanobacteria bacterium HKST-UBA02]
MMDWLLFSVALMVLPFLAIGTIRLLKARLQNRIGPPILQPVYNFFKLLGKEEVVSNDASWLFRFCAVANLCLALFLALILPWLSFKPVFLIEDLFLAIYLLALLRFFSILQALDAGSPFGGFGASREATLSLLVEPAVVLSLAAVAVIARSTDLGDMFSFARPHTLHDLTVWSTAGAALFLATLAELSRMPVDDPTTHLELTMVHEAMVIESSGPNLALVELSYSVRLVVMFGLAGQCFIHALACVIHPQASTLAVLSLLVIFSMLLITALVETVVVKLRWTRVPEYVAYAITMALLAAGGAIMGRMT